MDGKLDYVEEAPQRVELVAPPALVDVEALGGPDWAQPDFIGGYDVLERLGHGSLTTAYKVRRRGIEEVFAAKVLRQEFADNPRTAKRFMQEAKKAASLNNAHLVSVYEVSKTSTGVPFVICDFVEGGSLTGRLAESGPMDLAAVLVLLMQLCEGLSAAHEKGVIHRDIKPGNIVFKPGEAVELVKLADFGIAKVLPSEGRETKYLTPEGEAFGNPTYMSPEQIQGARLDLRADIYALGCVAYECLSGRPPFVGANCFQVALQQIKVEPEPLSWHMPVANASPAMEIVVMKMISKGVAYRYQSVAELMADLKVVAAGGMPKPAPTPVAESPSEEQSPEAALKGLVAEATAGAQALIVDERKKIKFDGKLAASSMDQSEPASYQLAEPHGGVEEAELVAVQDRSPALVEAEVGAGSAFAGADEAKKSADQIEPTTTSGSLAKEQKVVSKFGSRSFSGDFGLGSAFGFASGFLFCLMALSLLPRHILPDSDAASRGSSSRSSHVALRPMHRLLLQHYSLTAGATSREVPERYLPMNEVLRDVHNNVIFYYKQGFLTDAILDAVANHQKLDYADLHGQTFRSADLSFARLTCANLAGCHLEGAKLVGADLAGANLAGAFLINCRFQDADLRRANLVGADMSGSNMRGCDVNGVRISGDGVTQDMLNGVAPAVWIDDATAGP